MLTKHFEMQFYLSKSVLAECNGYMDCSFLLPPMPQTVCFFVLAMESQLVGNEHMIPPLSS